MFTTEKFIDSFQGAKKQAITVLVKDAVVAEALTDIVDAQTVYTKQFVNTLTEATKTLGSVAVKSATDFSKFDVTKMFKFAK